MRVIRNLLILCLLMVGMLLAVRQTGVAMGKGEVLAYRACQATCIPTLLDMHTLIQVGINLENVADMVWAETGDLYVVAFGATSRDYNIYQWRSKQLRRLDRVQAYSIDLIHHDNKRIIFQLNTGSGWQLRIWDGVQWGEFVFLGILQSNPYWAADGRFAFASLANNQAEIYVSDGLTSTSLGQYTVYYPTPVVTWSTDGRLAFSSDRSGNQEIYVWDGTTLTNISQHVGDDSQPAWSVDGRLAFSSNRSGNQEIYVWDGTTLTNISQTPEDDTQPQWNEEGQLTFVTGGRKVYIWGKNGFRLTNINRTGRGDFFNIRWVSHGRLFFRDDIMSGLWDDDIFAIRYLGNLIEYGDGGIAFITSSYRNDGLTELYVLDGQKIVATGLVGSIVHFKPDGRGGLLGRVCDANAINCDLYRWQDGRIDQITNTPDISENGPSFRP
jgi:WD40-like Beta Propeller Repeat